MSDIGRWFEIGVYNAKDFQNVYILEYWDDNMNVVDKVYKTKRNLLKAINRISAEWPERGVRARTVQGVRIVELLRSEVACTPGYQAIRVSESLNQTETILWYQGHYCCSRIDVHVVETIDTDEQLTKLVQTVAAGYGFSDVVARFRPLAKFNIRWSRKVDTWIDMDVCDYLQGVATDAVRDVLVGIFERIKNPYRELPITSNMKRAFGPWKTDKGIQGTFISRNNLELKDSGTVRLAMEQAGVTGYTETWYTPTKGQEEADEPPSPVITAFFGIVALPKGHKVDIEDLARRLAFAQKVYGE